MTSGAVLRYVLAGLAGLVVNLVVTVLLREVLGLPVELSFAIALVVVFCFYFVSNAYFVFRTKADRRMLVRYAVSAAAFRILDFVLFKGLVDHTPLFYPLAAALAIVISNTVKFVVYARFVFTGGDSDDGLW